jgi:hypothetical protein
MKMFKILCACRKQEMERFVIMAAKIIAPSIGASYSEGYDWLDLTFG